MMAKRWRSGDRAAESRGLTRRALLRDVAVGGALLAGGRVARVAAMQSPETPAYVPRPNRTQYAIDVGNVSINPDGTQPVAAVLANGTLPGTEIRVREGDQLRIVVGNRLADSPTSIHWHGLLVPAGMDGVPDVSNAPIAPGRTYVYEYPIRQSGTYWYHSHYGFQEQRGCYGAFIIEPAQEPLATDHDAVVLLGDWLHRNPSDVFAALRGQRQSTRKPMPMRSGAAMTMRRATPRAGATPPGGGTQMGSAMPTAGAMKMGSADVSDVKYDAFLLNGRGTADPWSLAVRPGERVRLRIINGAGSTYFRVRCDAHPLQITHADGLAVEPVTVDHLLIGMGEVYDALVTIGGAGSYTLHAVAQDGSGQALAVLHTPDVAPQANRAMPSFDGRALSYADLRAPAATTLPDGPLRQFRLPLGGDMARYVWMIGGQVWPKAEPLLIRRGDRVQLELINQSGMWHPMHLHGHFFRVLQGAGEYCPLKHTVNVAPAETVRIEFTADNPGNWFFHCHNTYHLEAGMARVIEYLA
jgi:FtsP/CotA-like multicopper oxidase with cupredoxin domain